MKFNHQKRQAHSFLTVALFPEIGGEEKAVPQAIFLSPRIEREKMLASQVTVRHFLPEGVLPSWSWVEWSTQVARMGSDFFLVHRSSHICTQSEEERRATTTSHRTCVSSTQKKFGETNKIERSKQFRRYSINSLLVRCIGNNRQTHCSHERGNFRCVEPAKKKTNSVLTFRLMENSRFLTFFFEIHCLAQFQNWLIKPKKEEHTG